MYVYCIYTFMKKNWFYMWIYQHAIQQIPGSSICFSCNQDLEVVMWESEA